MNWIRAGRWALAAGAAVLLVSGPAEAQERPIRAEESRDTALVAYPENFDPIRAEWEGDGGLRACPGVYVDPRDGETRLTLVRSHWVRETAPDSAGAAATREVAHGVYWTPSPNRYGLPPGRAVQIDCLRHAPVQIVDRLGATGAEQDQSCLSTLAGSTRVAR